MDIFKGWDNYTERLRENWNRIVSPEDTTVIVGDISWGMTLEEAEADFAFLHALNGRKLLLKGNHDYWFGTRAKVEQFFAAQGFDTLEILFNNAYEYGGYSLCGTRGWVNEKGEGGDRKIISREAGRLRLSMEAGRALGKPPIAFLHYL